MSGISKSQVSRLCKDIDERVAGFLGHALQGGWPYLWLDATYLKVRAGGRIVAVAAIIAVAVNSRSARDHRPAHRPPGGGGLNARLAPTPQAPWPMVA